jgi:hypothetical protein
MQVALGHGERTGGHALVEAAASVKKKPTKASPADIAVGLCRE